MFVNFIKENFQAIGIAKEGPALPEESAMLHIRARGLKAQPRKKLFLALGISIFIGLLLGLITTPISIFRRLPSLVFASIVGLIFWYFLDSSINQALIYSFITYLLINAYAIFWVVSLFIYDLIDIITYGSLTRLWINFYLMRFDVHKTHYNSRFTTHIYTSRLLFETDQMYREEKVFFDKIESLAYEEQAKKDLVENYWKNVDGSLYLK